jgi:signal peptidase I
VVFVNRLAYDLKFPLSSMVLARLGEPRRGDIVTFNSPADGVRLIKRVIGLPGDVIAMTDNRLSVNGAPVQYLVQGEVREELGGREIAALQVREELAGRSHAVQWLEGVRSRSSFNAITIPADHYLMLGDNRDNSADSRYIGLVARSLLVARAERVLVSADLGPHPRLRLERFGMSLYR